MTTATAAPSTTAAPLFAGFADLLNRVQHPRRPTARIRARVGDRDRQRLLEDLRALNDAPADIALR